MTPRFSAAKTNHCYCGILAFFLLVTGALYGQNNNALFIDSSGKVGIATNTPSQKLVVNGNALIGPSDNIAVGIDAQTNPRFGFIKKYGTFTQMSAAANTPIIFSQTNQADIFTNISGATLTERMRIDANGNVGINHPATPGYQLTVGGKDNVFGVDNAAIFSAKNASGTFEKYFWPRWDDNVMYMNYGANGLNIRNNSNTSALFIKNDGNTGIGKTNPSAKLEVAGRVKDETGYITPVGGIIMYGGAMTNFDNTGKGKAESPVAGWAVCNGQNGTPDLRNRFIVGAGPGANYSVGNTGGEDAHTLTIAEMPKHTHKYGYVCYDVIAAGQGGCWLRRNDINNGDETASAGESKPHENRPPYYAMLYIMKL